jgi:hypothetical protein
MRHHAIDAVAEGRRRSGRMRQHAGNDFPNRRVTGFGFGGGQAEAARSQTLPRLGEPLGKPGRLAGSQPVLDVAVGVQQQPFDQVPRDFMAVDGAQLASQLRNFFVKRSRKDRRDGGPAPFRRLENRLSHLFDAQPPMRLRHDYGNPQPLGKGSDVDRRSALPRNVRHVENQHSRQGDVEHLADEEQVSFQVRRVDDAGDRVQRTDVRLPSEEHFDRNHFVGRAGGETIRTGKVDES